MAPIGLERGKHQVHPTVTVNLLLKRGVRKVKTKNIEKYQRFTRLNGKKRENFGRMKSTGEPDVVK